MTEKEMKKLTRYQLLELLILQTEEIHTLQQQLQQTQQALEARNMQMSSIGSIAEASLQLGGVFTAAQNAVELYLESAQKRIAEMEAQAAAEAQRILAEARQQAAEINNNPQHRR